MTDQIYTQGKGVIFILLLALVVGLFAWRKGFFKLPEKKNFAPVFFFQVLGAFAIFFGIQIIFSVFAVLYVKPPLAEKTFELGWIQVAALVSIFIGVIGYCYIISSETRTGIFFGGQKENHFAVLRKGFGMGILALFIAYPFVVLATLLANLISLFLFGKAGVEQTAVQQLKSTMHYPLLFPITVFTIVVLVPIVEEILFRGFLQSWIKKWLGRSVAIPLTALIFSLAHYAKSHGTGNFELIVSLFTLSCFIGFIYERQRTIWAPIGVHMTFNALSVLMIALLSAFKA